MSKENGRPPDTGLTDIKKLAEQHRERQEAIEAQERQQEAANLSVVPPVVVMPVRAAEAKRRGKGVWILGAAILVAGGALAFVMRPGAGTPGPILDLRSPPPSAASPTATGTVPTADPPGPKVEALAPAAPEKAAAGPRAAEPEKVAEKASDDKAGSKEDARAKGEHKEKSGHHAGKAAAAPSKSIATVEQLSDKSKTEPKVEAVAAKPAPKKGARGDELDDLLADSAEGKTKAAVPSADDSNLPPAPSREAIASAMGRVKSKAQACYEKYHEAGLVSLDLMLDPSGHVTEATPTGKFADTDTGRCVASAAKSATLTKFRNGAFKIQFPFMIVAE